jgi:hypothetical protein
MNPRPAFNRPRLAQEKTTGGAFLSVTLVRIGRELRWGATQAA